MTDQQGMGVPIDHSNDLCVRILEEAEKETASILDAAQLEAGRIMGQSRQEAEAAHQEMMAAARGQAAVRERVILSGGMLQARRTRLNAREKIVVLTMETVMSTASIFALSDQYPARLKGKIIEAVLGLDINTAFVSGSVRDVKIFTRAFLDDIQHELREKHGRDVALEFRADPRIDTPGIVLMAKDGHAAYDNTFSRRMAGLYDQSRTWILKEVFKDDV